MKYKVDTPKKEYYKVITTWLNDNTEGAYFHNVYYIEFELHSDALMFMLRF